MYFQENLTLKVIDNSFIAQCIVFEITLQNQKGYVTYRSPSQSITEFDKFLSNFDTTEPDQTVETFFYNYTRRF